MSNETAVPGRKIQIHFYNNKRIPNKTGALRQIICSG